MNNVTRRRLLKVGAALGVASSVPLGAASEEDDGGHGGGGGGHSSPHLEKYVQPLPIPETREPDGRRRGAEYHEIVAEETTTSFHPDLPDTTVWGFDGQVPGPIVEGEQHRRLRLHFDSSEMPTDHLFHIDEEIKGTTSENYVDYDGPVPDVRQVTHVHGLNAPTAHDGQADMWTSPEGVTGPRYSEPVQEMPNRQERLTSVYHDHARGISRLNNYAGLVGPYYIKGHREEHLGLPEDEYDVPLVLLDRTFHEDGELYYPDEFVPNFAGDVPTINGAAWPYMEVEPRRYRFRIMNPSNGRTYGLKLAGHGDHGGEAPALHQISPGHGWLDDVVEIGHGGDMEKLVIAPFERAEVVVDFSEHAGETLTLENHAKFPFSGGGHGGGHDGGMDMGGMDGGMDGGMGGGHGGSSHPQIHELMQFRVADSASGRDNSTPPSQLRLPHRRGTNPEAAVETREVSLEMQMGTSPPLHTLNNNRWGDPIEIKPQLGTTEIWELTNTSMHTHPIHLHLVSFEVIGRGPDGNQPPHPNERGNKDVVRVDPDETVRIAVEFGDFPGKYPFHCHILEHEEHEMMRMFEVQAGNGNGHGRGGGRGRGRGRSRGNGR